MKDKHDAARHDLPEPVALSELSCVFLKQRRPAAGDSQREISEDTFSGKQANPDGKHVFHRRRSFAYHLGDAGDSDSVSVLVTSSKWLSLPRSICPGNFVKNAVNKAKVGNKKSHRLSAHRTRLRQLTLASQRLKK